MAGNDTTAPILEAIISNHHSPYTQIPPEEPRILRKPPPIFPLGRAVSHVEAEGSAKPGATIVFPFPTSREINIHYLETLWLEIP
ncbi:MAG: hypothetical protein ACOC3Z_02585, partial [Nanoarchaeota archaeon]